jgi:hypothetical protein
MAPATAKTGRLRSRRPSLRSAPLSELHTAGSSGTVMAPKGHAFTQREQFTHSVGVVVRCRHDSREASLRSTE